jgi:putative transposase
MRSKYKIINPDDTYFVTSSILKWVKIFSRDKYADILVDAIKYNQENKNLKIFAYVIMKDHFHLICQSNKMSNVMSSIKSYSAKLIIKQLQKDNEYRILKAFKENKQIFKSDRKYQVWQEGYHPQEVSNQKMFDQIVDYIHYNPVKANCVDDALLWKYSSITDYYLDKPGVIKLDIDSFLGF